MGTCCISSGLRNIKASYRSDASPARIVRLRSIVQICPRNHSVIQRMKTGDRSAIFRN